MSGWTQVATGQTHTCAIDSGAGVTCFGNNGYGQLGAQPTNGFAQPLTSVSFVAAKMLNTCAIKTDETLWCWGVTFFGTTTVNPPTQVGSAHWRSVVLSDIHNCGIQTDGTLWCWGSNYFGQLGTGNAWRTTPALVLPN
jgi:alpha-tubulin suppressor-like RCC1 family protein